MKFVQIKSNRKMNQMMITFHFLKSIKAWISKDKDKKTRIGLLKKIEIIQKLENVKIKQCIQWL